jgi:hypothetical protein
MAETVPGNTVSQDDSATLPSLIVTNFFTGNTPLFAKLADLSAFAQVQYAYYASIGVGQPLLGPYEALGRGFAETDAFKAKYGVLTTDFVATAYNDVFGRAPTADQTSHFDAQVAYFVSIYTNVGVAADTAALLAKGAVIGQMLGVAALTGDSAFDYSAAAKAFIAQMDSEGFVPGQPLSNFDDAPTAPGGGGGGTPPDTLDFTLVNGVLTLTANAGYTGALDGTNLRLTEPDGQTRAIALADITKIVVAQAGTKFDVAGAVLDSKAIQIDGAGVVNVTGVTFQAAAGTTKFEPSVNLDQLIHSSAAFVAGQSQFLVNGTVKDAIKTQWDFWDDKYVDAGGNAYTDAQINEATIRLGAKYIKDIDPSTTGGNGNVANAILDITGKADAAGRSQLLHDNLLGNVGMAAMQDRGFTSTKLAELAALIPDEYEARPWIGGYTTDSLANVGVAKAFDYEKGFARPDFVTHKENAAIDAAGRDGNELFFGDGNTVTGFSTTRHDGAGIELALKAKLRGGSDLPTNGVTETDGTLHFDAPGGHTLTNPSWGQAAKWNFDFSVLTGLNGRAAEDLSTYEFILRIDTDKSDLVNYKDFKLTVESAGKTPWIHNNQTLTARIGDDDGLGTTVSQNSVNVGFNFIRESIDANGNAADGVQVYDFSAGEFDIELIAMKGGVKLAGTHIVVDVLAGP